MKAFEKVNVKTAIPQKFAQLDLSCNHVTTQKFMSSRPVYYRQLVPKQSINLSMETLARMEAMPVPTFGKCDIISRVFFIPFRVVFPAWDDFYTQTLHSYSDGLSAFQTSVPVISQLELGKFIKLHSSISTQTNYDYMIGSDYYKIDQDFRPVYSTLVALGYNFVPEADSQQPENDSVYLSMLPLLCYMRIMVDWYYPSQFATNQTINILQEAFKRDVYADRNGMIYTAQDLENWLPMFNICAYDNDYFTSAWENPVSPISGTTPVQSTTDNTLTYNYSINTNNPSSTPMSQPAHITDHLLTLLRRMTSYMRRFNLAGSRAIDRMYSLFGVNLAPEKMNRSVYIDSYSQNIDVFDVMSNADSGNAVLGDYAGKGFSYGRGLKVNYSTDEFGIIMVINSIVPRVGYVDGYDRDVKQIHALDYFNGTYDSCGVRLIEKGELCSRSKNWESFSFRDLESGFGFTPQYSEYKFANDKMSGNFKLHSEIASLGSPSWHLNRMMFFDVPNDIVHSVDFVLGKDSSQYQRIFYATQDVDNFTMIFHFDVSSRAPMKSLYDSLDFEHEEDNAEVSMDNNGPKMN